MAKNQTELGKSLKLQKIQFDFTSFFFVWTFLNFLDHCADIDLIKIIFLHSSQLISVITRDNSSLSSMATDQLLDLFSLDETAEVQDNYDDDDSGKGKSSMKTILENLPELWDDSQYTSEYDLEAYGSSSSGAK